MRKLFAGVLFFLPLLVSGVPPQQHQQGWGQQPQQQVQQQGWGQQQPQQAQPSGWGQQQQQQGWGQQTQAQPAPAAGWGQQQPAQQQQGGWGQQEGGNDKGGNKGVDWEYNFALGYQGEKGGNKGGWGKSNMQQQSGGGGWSSEPETNIKKPSIGEIFGAILSFPRELKNLLKESGLWILFLPLLVIIPLFLFAFSAGKYFGGLDEGWGWDKRSSSPSSWLEKEWERLQGFIKDPKVQRAAQGFMDEFVAKRIIQSVEGKGVEDKVKGEGAEEKKSR